MQAAAIVLPVLAMAMLSFIMFLWMLLTRMRAMTALELGAQEAQDTVALRKKLPHSSNQVANNYNHLFEQPVVFYALCLSIAALDLTDTFFVVCAWIYVALRVCHSLVQAIIDVVPLRFLFFGSAWLLLALMTVREALLLI
ncbi:MAG: MAPEG family protein [Pseudomonadota bacterium]